MKNKFVCILEQALLSSMVFSSLVYAIPPTIAEQEFLAYAQEFIHSGTDINQLFSSPGIEHPIPLLHMAIASRFAEGTEYLLQQGADVHIQDGMQKTALHRASSAGFKEGVRLLIKYQANINAKDNANNTPLHELCNQGSVQKGSLATLRMLIDAGADVNAKNDDGYSPLHLLMKISEQNNNDSSEREALVKLLLEKGANVNQKGNEGNTPLHELATASCGDKDLLSVIKLLLTGTSLRPGANPNIKNEDGDTPLHTACFCKKLPMVKELLNYQANPWIKNNEEQIPLTKLIESTHITEETQDSDESSHRAVLDYNNHKEVFEILLRYSQSALDQEADDKQNTLLHYAVSHDLGADLVTRLVQVTPESINACNSELRTPLYHALEIGNVMAVYKLLYAGARTNIVDRQGLTPLGSLLWSAIDARLKLLCARLIILFNGTTQRHLLCQREPTNMYLDELDATALKNLDITKRFIADLKDNDALDRCSKQFLGIFLIDRYSTLFTQDNKPNIFRLLQNRQRTGTWDTPYRYT